jgi:pyruvate formate lyase activating enzyme
MEGVVFDIEEFAVFDGPGIRSVVFLKGCPLRCIWCHNPEGLLPYPQRARTVALCRHCGICDAACKAPGRCTACGTCVQACPAGCLRIVGQRMSEDEVAKKILRHGKLLMENGGGVTFSGGEPLMQPDFVLALREKLSMLHACLETSGYAPENQFQKVVQAMDLVIMDIKIMDPLLHKRYTGVDNRQILDNLSTLIGLEKPFRIRVPVIPTVNDTEENMQALAQELSKAKALEKVELMRYNKAAGAKYEGIGMKYQVSFPEKQEPKLPTDAFREANIRCDVL